MEIWESISKASTEKLLFNPIHQTWICSKGLMQLICVNSARIAEEDDTGAHPHTRFLLWFESFVRGCGCVPCKSQLIYLIGLPLCGPDAPAIHPHLNVIVWAAGEKAFSLSQGL